MNQDHSAIHSVGPLHELLAPYIGLLWRLLTSIALLGLALFIS